ncbi:hldD [Symbiodinium microadriaticum]|nr:hldD [Symbiodinium microadriaticum]
MIVVTGAAGFIGSCMIQKLNDEQFNDIIAVDQFDKPEKNRNLENKTIRLKVDRNEFIEWLDSNHKHTEFIVHLGARTDTTLQDKAIFDSLNLNYSKNIWKKSVQYDIPLIFASSAATYGAGEHGYNDSHDVISKLSPLNDYGVSKNEFDHWAINQENHPFFWAGLKFFNVYGPNEYHKGRMASVVFHAYNQISSSGKVELFRSHNSNFKNGEQIRDFIYVMDVVDVIFWLMNHRRNSGIYNLGTGKGQTFLELVEALFKSMHKPANIEFIDTPIDIRDKYQYYTQANMAKLRDIGYTRSYRDLEQGVQEYSQFLFAHQYY